MKSKKTCGIIIFRKDKSQINYLLIKQTKNVSWGFPKGRSETDETEIETASREVFEETGLKVKLVEGFREETQHITPKGKNKLFIFLLGEAINTKIHVQEKEISEYAWLNYEEA